MAEQKKEQKSVSNEPEKLSDEQLKEVAGGVRPPSGDSNPSDLSNRTINTDDIIDPHDNPNVP